MTQPALFDLPTSSPRQAVNRLRDAALRQVEANAEAARKHFSADAAAFVRSYLAACGPTSGEQLTEACKAAGIVPHDDRSFGPILMKLSRQGVIKKVGTCQRVRGHNTAGGNLWSLA